MTLQTLTDKVAKMVVSRVNRRSQQSIRSHLLFIIALLVLPFLDRTVLANCI